MARAATPEVYIRRSDTPADLVVPGDLEKEISEGIPQMRRDEPGELLGRGHRGVAIAQGSELQANQRVIRLLDELRRDGRGEKDTGDDPAGFARVELHGSRM